MTVNIRLFAMMRDAAGTNGFALQLPSGATVQQALESIATEHPPLETYIGKLAVAVNLEYVHLDRTLHDGDEMALIPPVSGG